jgi:hypothetical protein
MILSHDTNTEVRFLRIYTSRLSSLGITGTLFVKRVPYKQTNYKLHTTPIFDSLDSSLYLIAKPSRDLPSYITTSHLHEAYKNSL